MPTGEHESAELDLPSSVEQRCYEIWFTMRSGDRADAIAQIATDHATLAEPIRALFGRLEQADQLIGSVSDEIDEPTERPTVVGYELLSELGSGGFGTVFRARQLYPVEREVALKALHTSRLDDRARARFAGERRALGALLHPAIAQVYDAGVTADDRPFLAMELVSGVPITEYCDQHRLDLEARIRLVMVLCEAMTHAHQRSIVHRDLKPGNVLVSGPPTNPRPKIIDFGLAKALDPDLDPGLAATVEGGFLGTPGYTSPEQAAGATIDVRTDIYALGLMLHELLTGDVPLGKERLRSASLTEALRRVRDEEPRASSQTLLDLGDAAGAAAERLRTTPQRLTARLRGDLDRIGLHALARDREQRYSSAEALADDLNRFLEHLPIKVHRPSTGYLLRKFAQRHRLVVAATILIVTAIAGGGAALTWGLIEVSAARDDANELEEAARQESYNAQLTAANLARIQGHVQVAHRNLDATPEKLRGWEYDLLRGSLDLSRKSVRLREAHDLWQGAAWLECGLVAVAAHRGGIWLWDPATEEARHSPAIGASPIAGFAGLGGNLALIAHGKPGRLVVMDLRTNEELRELMRFSGTMNHTFTVSGDGRCYAFSLDHRGLYWGSVDPATDAGEPHHLELPDLRITGLQLDHTGDSVFVGTENGRLLRLGRDGTPIGPTFALPPTMTPAAYEKMAHDERTNTLVSADLLERLIFWDVETGQLRALDHLTGSAQEFVNDGTSLLVAGGFETPMAGAWSFETGEALCRYHAPCRGGVHGLAVSPDGSEVVTVGIDGNAHLFDRRPWQLPERFALGYDCREVAHDATTDRIAWVATDGTVGVLDLHSRKPILQLELPSPAHWVAMRGDHVWVPGMDRHLRRIDIERREVDLDVPCEGALAQSIAASPDGSRIVVSTYEPRLVALDGATLDVLWHEPLEDRVCALEFGPHGQLYAAAEGGHLRRLDPASGVTLAETTVGPIWSGASMLYPTPDGDAILLPQRFETVALSSATLTELWRLPVHGHIAYSPDGERMVVGRGRALHVLDTRSRREIVVLEALQQPLRHVFFSSNGRELVTHNHRYHAPTSLQFWTRR